MTMENPIPDTPHPAPEEWAAARAAELAAIGYPVFGADGAFVRLEGIVHFRVSPTVFQPPHVVLEMYARSRTGKADAFHDGEFWLQRMIDCAVAAFFARSLLQASAGQAGFVDAAEQARQWVRWGVTAGLTDRDEG